MNATPMDVDSTPHVKAKHTKNPRFPPEARSFTLGIVELDRPTMFFTVALPLPRGDKFKHIEEHVVNEWNKRRNECVEPFVAGVYSVERFDEDPAKVVARVQRDQLLAFDDVIGQEHTHVLTMVVVPRPGHRNFTDCQPMEAWTNKRLHNFFKTHTTDTIPPPPLVTFSGRSVFVRNAYKKLEAAIKTHTRPVVVTGRPGAGKTMFLWYLLHKYYSERRLVVFDCDGYFMLARPDGVIVFGNRDSSFRCYLQDPCTIYLYDAVPRHHVLYGGGICAETIVTAYPDQVMADQLAKTIEPKTLKMPQWSLDELKSCHCMCYEGCDTIESVYGLFGRTT